MVFLMMSWRFCNVSKVGDVTGDIYFALIRRLSGVFVHQEILSSMFSIREYKEVCKSAKPNFKNWIQRINFSPMTHFYIPWKCQKTRFSDVFQGFRNRSLGEIGSIDCDLNMYSFSIFLNYISILILTLTFISLHYIQWRYFVYFVENEYNDRDDSDENEYKNRDDSDQNEYNDRDDSDENISLFRKAKA